MISLEVESLAVTRALDVDDRKQNYNLLGTAIETFSALLELSTSQDIRRTVTWNRFLAEHPEVVGSPADAAHRDDAAQQEQGSKARPKTTKRIIPLYRIAPEQREIGTVEFDGHYEAGRCVVTLRDWLRRGYVDMQGQHIWRATLETVPKPKIPPRDATS